MRKQTYTFVVTHQLVLKDVDEKNLPKLRTAIKNLARIYWRYSIITIAHRNPRTKEYVTTSRVPQIKSLSVIY